MIAQSQQEAYGFVIISGNGLLCGRVQGHKKTTEVRTRVTLPNKQSHGGQSEQRFKRLVAEARHNYLTKATETVLATFSPRDKLVLAGPANWKDVLAEKIASVRTVIGKLDIAGEGEAGFHEALQKSESLLTEVRYFKELQVLEPFFTAIAQDTGLAVYGRRETLRHLNNLRTLIVAEDQLHNPDEEISEALKKLPAHVRLHVVSGSTAQGHQFCIGFGGIGGIAQFRVDDDEHKELYEEPELTEWEETC